MINSKPEAYSIKSLTRCERDYNLQILRHPLVTHYNPKGKLSHDNGDHTQHIHEDKNQSKYLPSFSLIRNSMDLRVHPYLGKNGSRYQNKFFEYQEPKDQVLVLKEHY